MLLSTFAAIPMPMNFLSKSGAQLRVRSMIFPVGARVAGSDLQQ